MELDAVDNRYDTNLSPHINLLCTVRGRIADLDHDLPVSPAEVEEQLDFVTVEVPTEYRGRCGACRDRTRGE